MAKDIKLRKEIKNWRELFPASYLESAERILNSGKILSFKASGDHANALLETKPGFQCRVSLFAPTRYEEDWDSDRFSCSCVAKRHHRYLRKGGWQSATICQHEAAVLLKWEAEHGVWEFSESQEAYSERVRKEQERQQRRAEQERLRREKKRKVQEKLPAVSFFGAEERDDLFFSVKRALSDSQTNRYCADRASALLKADAVKMDEPQLSYNVRGARTLDVSATVRDSGGNCRVRIQLLPNALDFHHCSCNADYQFYVYAYGMHDELCEHELALLDNILHYVNIHNPGDVTDKAAENFFQAMNRFSSAMEEQAEEAAEPQRPRCVLLAPRILMADGTAVLSYKLGIEGQKAMLLHSYREFLDAVEQHQVFSLSKTTSIDFSAMDLTDSSLPWLTFLQRRISETDVANDKLSQGYYYSSTLKVKTRDTLVGATLDRFYELAEGSTVEYQDSDRKQNGRLLVGHTKLRVSLSSARIEDKKHRLLGVEISGRTPLILKGSAGSYMLSSECLSKITAEETLTLRPFSAAADPAGNILFRVGKDKLAEFYYRALPLLAQSPYVDFIDNCAEEVSALLPPEPQFLFRFDLDEATRRITCEAQVSYAETAPRDLPYPAANGEYRDAIQEERVLSAVKRYFPEYLASRGQHWADFTEDALYRILREALPELSRFGQIEGSSAFDRSAVRPMPQLRVGVSVDSGLLEIDLLSRDMSPEELLAVLESYRLKKRYHRLASGAFLELEDDSQLRELNRLSAGMDFSLADAANGGVKLPMYRALYLDSLLEEHDALAANRDRTYRALIKNFKTIRDADYELPGAQAEILRPYQAHGYKWLRTLAAAGFGGILADEMGLGKTLQFITLAQALFDAGELSLCLVVCPASLCYNWQEELQRFAPTLDAHVIAGAAAVRKKHLAALPKGAVCITSYDLLRQDIAEYQKLRFSLMVLDEAQYIKNQKAAMTKAVKAVPANLRFALTGTPIENRLAELWSIFDYLMPGFLYRYSEFSERFETPITKRQDAEATERLKRMTAPFILRRLKADVLKDLPPKLEEVRYTRFDDEQRKIYDGQVVRMKQLVSSVTGSGDDKLRIFAELTRIRQICCDPSLLLEDYHGGSAKRSACLDLIQTAIGGGHRMLVFSQFTSMLALLEADLFKAGIPCYKLTGATPKEERLKLVRDFNEGDVPVFLISLKAGGTGLNLTGADIVIHYDPWWNLAAQNQATDRAHRIGQANQVTVYRIIVKDSIEERILAMQEAKRDLADAVLSGESRSLAALSSEELLELLG